MVWRGRCFAVKVARLPRSWLPLSVVAAAVAGVMLVVDGVVNRACFTSHGACISDLSTLYRCAVFLAMRSLTCTRVTSGCRAAQSSIRC
jgi:hypothetical protein